MKHFRRDDPIIKARVKRAKLSKLSDDLTELHMYILAQKIAEKVVREINFWKNLKRPEGVKK